MKNVFSQNFARGILYNYKRQMVEQENNKPLHSSDPSLHIDEEGSQAYYFWLMYLQIDRPLLQPTCAETWPIKFHRRFKKQQQSNSPVHCF